MPWEDVTMKTETSLQSVGILKQMMNGKMLPVYLKLSGNVPVIYLDCVVQFKV